MTITSNMALIISQGRHSALLLASCSEIGFIIMHRTHQLAIRRRFMYIYSDHLSLKGDFSFLWLCQLIYRNIIVLLKEKYYQTKIATYYSKLAELLTAFFFTKAARSLGSCLYIYIYTCIWQFIGLVYTLRLSDKNDFKHALLLLSQLNQT